MPRTELNRVTSARFNKALVQMIEGRVVVRTMEVWGDAPAEDHKVRTIGSHTGRLISNERDFDPWTGIPRMSAIPVNIRKVEEPVGV